MFQRNKTGTLVPMASKIITQKRALEEDGKNEGNHAEVSEPFDDRVGAVESFQRHGLVAISQVLGVVSRRQDTIWRPFLKSSASSPVVFTVLFLLFVGAIVSTRFLNSANLAGPTITKIFERPPQKIEIPLNCTAYDPTRTCPSNYTTAHNKQDDLDRPSPPTCPDYFRWIYEDLRPWAHTGISRDMVERAKPTADFRLVIVNGKAYVETYRRSFQTRDIFTLWGILQLLRRYPGRVPDLDLMFNCGDLPLILSKSYSGANATSPPPLFHYCADDYTLDIVFPDWSFWGWYKIYIEGVAWSVSEKYILACDSVTLLVKSHFYDFFTRSLVPMQHYWPIKVDDKCRSIKFAVDWGNSHKTKAKSIGKAGSRFIQEELKMEYVYDFMFHLLNEYAKLLKFKPSIPEKAVEFCSESMACTTEGLGKKFMMDSMVKGPADSRPCTMPPPYGPSSLYSLIQRKASSIEEVEMWQDKYFGKSK
ncbi:hypothetical protein L484_001408 [Morus notabilis]|uniref:Glycosyl transferase CAP10 domain-containing protein n=1 Tax=Morus notabilis TaxID=981085 RepID=W9S1X4_9ROSA|nr:hypothetical protein L484_001408 [Morus notabilis]